MLDFMGANNQRATLVLILVSKKACNGKISAAIAPEDARQGTQVQGAPSQGTARRGTDDDQKARAKSGKSKSKTDDEPSPGGYTARLLQAKKRALKNQRDSEEGD